MILKTIPVKLALLSAFGAWGTTLGLEWLWLRSNPSISPLVHALCMALGLAAPLLYFHGAANLPLPVPLLPHWESVAAALVLASAARFVHADRLPWSVATVLASLVIAPLLEEWFFRGVLLHHLRARTVEAVVVSSMLFGMVHGTWSRFVYASLMGILLSVLYLRRKSLSETWLVHLAINASLFE